MKIDILIDDRYYCSTTQHKTCKEALEKLMKNIDLYPQSYATLREARANGKRITARRDKNA